MARLLTVFVAALLAVSVSQAVVFTTCPDTDQCTVSEVRISGCGATSSRCSLRRGHNSTLEFDYTAAFSSNDIINKVEWVRMEGNQPWAGLDSVGCKFTTCPLEASKSSTFSYPLHIGAKLPKGKYTVRWQVLDSADEAKTCCFETTIRLK